MPRCCPGRAGRGAQPPRLSPTVSRVLGTLAVRNMTRCFRPAMPIRAGCVERKKPRQSTRTSINDVKSRRRCLAARVSACLPPALRCSRGQPPQRPPTANPRTSSGRPPTLRVSSWHIFEPLIVQQAPVLAGSAARYAIAIRVAPSQALCRMRARALPCCCLRSGTRRRRGTSRASSSGETCFIACARCMT